MRTHTAWNGIKGKRPMNAATKQRLAIECRAIFVGARAAAAFENGPAKGPQTILRRNASWMANKNKNENIRNGKPIHNTRRPNRRNMNMHKTANQSGVFMCAHLIGALHRASIYHRIRCGRWCGAFAIGWCAVGVCVRVHCVCR